MKSKSFSWGGRGLVLDGQQLRPFIDDRLPGGSRRMGRAISTRGDARLAIVRRWRNGIAMAALACLAVGAAPSRAVAEFTVCNQTLDVVNVAIGQSAEQSFHTEGWWTIGANRCVNVIQEPLVNRYIYVYANDVFGQPVLNGSTPMCVGTRRFMIDGIGSCWERGHSAVPFYEVDTQAVERWTLFLQQPRGP